MLRAWFKVLQQTPLRDHWLVNTVILNLALSTSTIAMVGVLGRRLARPWIGAISAVMVALFPSLIYHSATILTETTFNFLFLAALLVLCWHRWSNRFPSWTRLVVFSVLYGVCV